jgi:hypothetical protein
MNVRPSSSDSVATRRDLGLMIKSVIFQHAFRYVLCSAFTEIASENWFVGMTSASRLNPP